MRDVDVKSSFTQRKLWAVIGTSQIVTNRVDHLSEIEILQSFPNVCAWHFTRRTSWCFLCKINLSHLNFPHSNFAWTDARFLSKVQFCPTKARKSIMKTLITSPAGDLEPGQDRNLGAVAKMVVSDRDNHHVDSKEKWQSSRYHFCWKQKPRNMQDIPLQAANHFPETFCDQNFLFTRCLSPVEAVFGHFCGIVQMVIEKPHLGLFKCLRFNSHNPQSYWACLPIEWYM